MVERIDLRRVVPVWHFDAVFRLGLLEYIPDVASLARRLEGIGTIIIVSYAIADTNPELIEYDRLAPQCRHSYTRPQFEDIFRRAGLQLEASAEAEKGATVLWCGAGGPGCNPMELDFRARRRSPVATSGIVPTFRIAYPFLGRSLRYEATRREQIQTRLS